MECHEFTPRAALGPYVQLLWGVEAASAAALGPPERIAPDGIVELVVHLRGRVRVGFGEEVATPRPSSFVICQTRRFVELALPDSIGFLSVRFLPWGALHFMDAPVSSLADQIIPASDIWGTAVADLEEQLAGAPSWSGRVRVVESFLLDQLRRYRRRDVELAVRAVWRKAGSLRVPDLCHELGVSERTAQRLFRRTVGLPPKGYSRLVRFLNACSALRSDEWRTLSQVAHRCGYYDQSHFDGEFKEFSGVTPTEFLGIHSFSFLELPDMADFSKSPTVAGATIP